MEQEEINIKRVNNGFIVNTKYFSESTGDMNTKQLVFEEKDSSNNYNEYTLSKESMECLHSLIKHIENIFGLEGNNKGDYYLHHEIKRIPLEDEEE